MNDLELYNGLAERLRIPVVHPKDPVTMEPILHAIGALLDRIEALESRGAIFR